MVIAPNLGAAAATVICAAVAGGFLFVGCAKHSTGARDLHARTVDFSGHTWRVRWNAEPQGPGPNYFSDSRANVRVDDSGRLHLRLRHVNGRWYAAAVISQKVFGYGRYLFELDSPVHELDPGVVLGLFTWNTTDIHHNRELDIEFSRFGNEGSPANGNFVVQPYDLPGHQRKFVQPAVAQSTHWFDWQPGSVTFGSSSAAPSSWRYEGPDVPPPSAPVRMNLWLYQGLPPKDTDPIEVVVRRFTFTPAP